MNPIDGAGIIFEAEHFKRIVPRAADALASFELRAAPRKHTGRPRAGDRPMPFAVVRARRHGRAGKQYTLVGSYARLDQAKTAAELTILAGFGGGDQAWIILAPHFALRPVRRV